MSSPSPAEERAASMIGRVLSDRYRIDAIVATGSMGAVYRGFHLKTRKAVALKILHPEIEGFPEMVARFEREAVAGAHIEHRNVASASDMGTFDDGSYFLVLELVRGRTLRELIDSEGPLKPLRAIAIAKQIAAGLGAAHARGIIHRDLKPLNVMVTSDASEQVKIIDFGLARIPVDSVAPMAGEEPVARVSTPGIVFGTVAYMAPEVVAGMDAVDERSDLYSLGLILYEMLTREHPFDPGAFHEVIAQHRERPPPPLRERNPSANVPPALEAVVMRLLAKEPERRYPDTDALIEALDAGSPAIDETSTRAVARGAVSVAPSRRNVAMIGVAALLVVAIGIIGVALFRGNDPKSETAAVVSAPPSSSAEEPAPPPRKDLAADLRAELVAAAAKEDLDAADASSILVALADADPKALQAPEIRTAATQVATRIGSAGGDEATQAFYALAYRFGPEGLDVLYDISVDAEHQRAARRASAILEVQTRTGRPSPALRIVLEIKRAACKQKPLLFARAAAEGDARAIPVLEALRPPTCDPDGGACCFRRHVGLEKTIEALQERFPAKK
ncbi:MAG: serine/threonine protein kinase [Polyangiaceae bacterium]|nr:serine/threonine protein kinase [Polyangiaceae bacterium]